jgi:hypothetical protein
MWQIPVNLRVNVREDKAGPEWQASTFPKHSKNSLIRLRRLIQWLNEKLRADACQSGQALSSHSLVIYGVMYLLYGMNLALINHLPGWVESSCSFADCDMLPSSASYDQIEVRLFWLLHVLIVSKLFHLTSEHGQTTSESQRDVG